MTISEIRSNIQYNDNLIGSYNGQIRQIEMQLEELEMLRSKFSKLGTRFEDRQTQRKSSLSKFQNKKIHSEIVSGYYAGMNTLLAGNECNTVCDGLSEARSKINHKIYVLQNEIQNYESKIAGLRQSNSYWQSQMAYAEDI